jgi:AraC-like DNA-binding protein
MGAKDRNVQTQHHPTISEGASNDLLAMTAEYANVKRRRDDHDALFCNDAAVAVGYDSVSAFTRAFRMIYRQQPSQFKQLHGR